MSRLRTEQWMKEFHQKRFRQRFIGFLNRFDVLLTRMYKNHSFEIYQRGYNGGFYDGKKEVNKDQFHCNVKYCSDRNPKENLNKH